MSSEIIRLEKASPHLSDLPEEQHFLGKMVHRTVVWLKQATDSSLLKILKKIITIAIAVICSLSLVGIPILLLAAREWKNLREPERNQGTPQGNPSQGEEGAADTTFSEDLVTLSEEPEDLRHPDSKFEEAKAELPAHQDKPDIPAPVVLQTCDLPIAPSEATPVNACGQLFKDLKSQSAELLKDQTFLVDKKDVLCRFLDIGCVAKTAVSVPGFEHPFIHANRVQFNREHLPLASQATKQSPFRWFLAQAPIGKEKGYQQMDTREQFWKGVLNNTNLIIDLTKPGDLASQYCPDSVHKPWTDIGKQQFGKITVTVSEILVKKYGIQVFKLLVKEGAAGKPKEVVRIHYPSWVDHAGIGKENLHKIAYLRALEKEYFKSAPNSLAPLVHCRAGVGRSGTYVTASAILDLNDEKLLTEENSIGIISKLILEGRRQRGPAFVQSQAQLKTLLDLTGMLLGKEEDPDLEIEPSQPEDLEIFLQSLPASSVKSPAEIAKESLANILALEEQGIATQQAVSTLQLSIDSLLPQVLDGTLGDETKKSLFQALNRIKKGAGCHWNEGYVHMDTPKEFLGIPDPMKVKINQMLNAIQSNVPPAVRQHPAYQKEIIQCKTPVQTAGKMTLARYKAFESEGVTPAAVYLYRDSSSRSGPEAIHTFTTTFCYKCKNGSLATNNMRMAYNGRTRRWQLANPLSEQSKPNPKYDLESSSVVIDSSKEPTRLEALKKWFPEDQLTFDKEGNLINSFSSLETLTKIMISEYILSPPEEIFPFLE